MLYRIIANGGRFALYEFPDPWDGGPDKGQLVSIEKLRSGAIQNNDLELRQFFLAIEILIAGGRGQRYTVDRLTAPGIRSFRTGVKRTVSYLEIGRYPELAKKGNYQKNRNRVEMANFNDLNEILRTALAPVKEMLRLPADNPSEFSYTVPADLVSSVSQHACKNYLKSLVTYGPLTSVKFNKVVNKLHSDYPDHALIIIEAMKKTESQAHLSAISFDDHAGQLLVSMVNVHGDLLRIEGYKFLRLIDDHDKDSGWLSLGSLDRKDEWLPEPLLRFNKEQNGELIARYSPAESSLSVQLRKVTDKKSGKTETSAQALFILDQDYLVCLYIAIARLKMNKARFEELREIAETKVVANMDDLEADLFD